MNSSEKATISARSRGRLRARLAGEFQIAGDIADNRIELRYGNGKTVGESLVHGPRSSAPPAFAKAGTPSGVPSGNDQAFRGGNAAVTSLQPPATASPCLDAWS